jgi:hypothetical protein
MLRNEPSRQHSPRERCNATGITLALFAACNGFRVVAYVPQILTSASDKIGASSISFVT